MRRLVARNEQDHRVLVGAVDVLVPGAARDRERVELFPFEALAVDDRMASALERRDQQVRGLPHRQRALAGAQHLHQEGDGLEHRLAGRGIDVFDGQGVVGVAVPVLVPLEQLPHHLPAVDEHRRGEAGPAGLLAGEARHQAAISVDALRVVRGKALRLLLLRHHHAVLDLGIIVVEMDGVEGLDQREVEHREIERTLVADGSVVVPSVIRGEDHVARPEHDVLAVDAGEVALALEPEADGARRVLVRRHDLVGVVEAIGGVHRAHGRALGCETGIDEDERAALGVFHRDQFYRLVQNWFDVLGAAPQVRHGPRGRHQLLDLVVGDIRRGRPEREHVLRGDVAIQGFQGGVPIGEAVHVVRGHVCLPAFARMMRGPLPRGAVNQT